jgi:hypothetical protein
VTAPKLLTAAAKVSEVMHSGSRFEVIEVTAREVANLTGADDLDQIELLLELLWAAHREN